MGRDGRMRDRIGEGIKRLEERFGSFPVNQTTLSVCEPDYETARERAREGTIDVYVWVRNGDGEVLHLSDGREYATPRCVNGPDQPLGLSVARAVREATDVECTVDGIDRVTIAGVNNEGDPAAPTVYRLIGVLNAEHERGRPIGASWESEAPAIPEYV